MNPWKALLKSRKFWIMVLDFVVSVATYAITNFVAPEAAQHVLWFIGALQVPAAFLIGAIAYEDGQAKRSGTFEVPE